MSEYKDKKKMKKLGLLEMSNPAKKVQLTKEVGENFSKKSWKQSSCNGCLKLKI